MYVPLNANPGYTGDIYIAGSDGFANFYSISPSSTSTYLFAVVPLPPSTVANFYNINSKTGVPTPAIVKSIQYNVLSQRWYINAVASKTHGIVWSTPFIPPTGNGVAITASQAFVNATGGVRGVVMVTMQVNDLHSYLVSVNTQANVILYLMETGTNILIANSVYATTNATEAASESANEFIKNSALYISKNLISSPTSQYAQEYGFAVTVRFWAPQSGGAAGLTWTLVAVDSNTVATAQYVTSTTTTTTAASAASPSDDSFHATRTLTSLSAATLAGVVVLIALGVVGLLCPRTPAPPLSKGGDQL